VAVIPWNPKRQKNRSCLPPTWTAAELGKRTSIERFFGRVFSLFSLLYFKTGDPMHLTNLSFLSFLAFLSYLRPNPPSEGATMTPAATP